MDRYAMNAWMCIGYGTDKLTIAPLESGDSMPRTTQTRTAAGVILELWGGTRRSEQRRPAPAS